MDVRRVKSSREWDGSVAMERKNILRIEDGEDWWEEEDLI
jgi:hypothetical protein